MRFGLLTVSIIFCSFKFSLLICIFCSPSLIVGDCGVKERVVVVRGICKVDVDEEDDEANEEEEEEEEEEEDEDNNDEEEEEDDSSVFKVVVETDRVIYWG